jgi:hypothetical protein
MKRIYLSISLCLLCLVLGAQILIQNGNSDVDLTSADSWVIFQDTRASQITASDISGITINGEPAVIGENVRVKSYYSGAAIIPLMEGFYPIAVYSDSGQKGNTETAAIHTIYTNNDLPLGDNTIASFTLQKGYMATFAQNDDGTGRSKVYIAAEDSLSVDLPAELVGEVSFLRVMEWNYVNKRGFDSGKQEELDALNVNWFYHWTIEDTTRMNQEFVPMTWGGGTAKNNMNDIIALENVTHLLGFNESDNCNGQSGQWGDLCKIDVAVATYKNLLKSGLRLVTPSGREEAANNSGSWTSLFLKEAKNQNIRIDVVGIHWYDWGDWSKNHDANADPNSVFTRFTKYLTKVHDMYDLPIMITEFNANKNRTHEVNKAFMELAIPWLESTEWIERYCWFQPNGGAADMFNTNGNITDVGIIWRDQVSTPSIPDKTLASPNLQEIILFNDNLTSSQEEKINPTGMHIYPNPAKGMFIINFTGIEKAKISFYNLHGQMIHSKTVYNNKYTFANNSFEPGIYLVKAIDSKNYIYTQKLIIK